MNTWWHRLFIVLEIGLLILGTLAFAFVAYNDTSMPWWGALIAWIPALLMTILHAATTFVIEG